MTQAQSSPIEVYAQAIANGTFKADDAQARAVDALQDLYIHIVNGNTAPKNWLARLLPGSRDVPHAQGVYLYGPVGRGKSAMMDLFFACLPDTILKRRVHFHAFMLEVHAFLHDLRTKGHGAVDDALPKFAAHVIQTARVVCFDEFHVVDVADAMILSRLFTALYDAGINVVTTSNWAPDDLYKKGLQRELFLPFIALIKARMKVVTVAGPHDYRVDRIAGKPVYFHPLNATADAAMDEVFRDLTDGGQGAPETFDVLGHHVTIPRVSHGVARVSFSDVCEKPLAAQDYLAIAARYHTVIIDHVPKLTYDRRNETKRLMILVDILYEQRRRLIMSADASLDRLFVDNEHAFEFQRTLSRLTEMGSVGYYVQ